MPTNFFTNKTGNTLIEKFEAVFKHNPGIKNFDALVGYLRASGYFRLRESLGNVEKIRILVGINVDRQIQEAHSKGIEFFQNHDKTKEEFVQEMLEDIEKADYDKKTENSIKQFITDLIDKKIEVKAHPDKKIHAKVYIFYKDIFNQHNKECAVITGSSNLTDAGLGTSEKHNYEFNVELSGYDDVRFAYDEFEELWKDSVNILEADAEVIKKKSYLKDDFTPFELYIKMLIEYFGNRVEYDPYNIELLLPEKYMRLKYQTDAANQGYAMMMKHNGFILADVVGLGKTIIASMIIKKFIYENGSHTKVLVVVPPAIKSSWQRTANDFMIDNHLRYVTIGSLHNILDKDNTDFPDAEYFDLIIVDESHKFRNDYTEMYLALQEICKTPRNKPGENGDKRKKVILISATPLNNRPEDIENQLYLFQDKRNSTLDTVKNLQDYFKPVNDRYKKLSAEATLNIPKLKALFNQLRNDVVEPLVIRRTRKDIENNEEYLEDLKKQNIVFPKVGDPEALEYELDTTLAKLFADTVELIAGVDENGHPLSSAIQYYRYRAIEFLINEADRKLYTKGKTTVQSISERLAAIMRILMVKRLESSFFAFQESLRRFQKSCQNMIDMFASDRVFIAPDLDINKLKEDGLSDDAILKKMEEKGGNNREFKSSAFSTDFIENLQSDKRKIDSLIQRWNKVTYDPKMDEFISNLKTTFFKKTRNHSGKLVIFTESTETANEIKLRMEEAGYSKILSVSSNNRETEAAAIRYNFDANLEEELWKQDYNIIITTEVLAEGVNLHRSNIIINYDVPWNSTRLMQRIGRVNRIGTRAKKIYVYNYYPSANGDAQIRLINAALRKLQAFHTAFGEDNKIFSLMEEVGDGALHGLKIQQEESEILKYLNELRAFKKVNKKKFDVIAAIPNKARTGRDKENLLHKEIIIQAETAVSLKLKNASLCYLKADNHPGIFCFVSEAMNPQELGFLDAAKIFKSNADEKPVSLHELHFAQAQTAYTHFKSETIQNNFIGISKKSISPAENKAITNLNFAIKHAITPQKKEALKLAVKSIESGAFNSKGFPKAINDFFTESTKLFTRQPDRFYDLLFSGIIDRYNFNPDTATKIQVQENSIVNPKIVLTLSIK
ncbi:helicase-related protein [Ferruginibacter albus]|uniref:helicase-related protein n=1 Tax=Ferruginibacter albus TaxID=2875540 RepID=UPI001CC71C21|nr:helicase-related protein [Ferruginibacter albus]UAY52136.1 helicase [Ferruginibacter albus]